MTVRDLRNAGWCWQEKAVLDALRAFYSDDRLKRRATALAIYLVLSEIASDQHERGHAETTHRVIWERTGTSETTVKQYLREFVALGLLGIERQEAAPGINLPNVYTLLSPGAMDGPTGAVEAVEGGAVDGPTGAAGRLHPEERSFKNGHEEAASTQQQGQETSAERIARLRRAVR